jgi:acyl-coenzyme A synthetase/AMP-(fatty) acid ligase
LLNACTLVDSRDPDFWKRSGVNVLFCSPGQFETFHSGFPFTHRFAKVEVSGAKLDDDVARLLAGHFDEIVDVYGASETNKSYVNHVTVDDAGQVTRKGKHFDSEVEVRDTEGRPILVGQIGEVRVRNDYMIPGYLAAPEATQKAFVDGWFIPGDLARWGANGTLEVLGRVDEVISFGGVKIDGKLIDMIIKGVPGIQDAVSVRSPKIERREIVGFIVFEDGVNKALCVQNVRDAYQHYTGLPCFLGPLHEIKEVPYDEDGRPMRHLCEQMLSAKIDAKQGTVSKVK